MSMLSVIICVCNTDAKLFEECLTSVFDSTLKDIEVIVVDDGSTENYEKLEKKFSDARFVKTEHQGTLAARMTGARLATGKYVIYADSDDVVSFDFYEGMVQKAEQVDADIVFNDWAFLKGNCAYVCANDYTIKHVFLADGTSPLRMYFAPQGKEHSWYVLWNKIFKRELLLNAMKEIERLGVSNHVFAEDVLVTFFAFTEAKKIVNLHLGHYFYRIHGSQQVATNSKEKFLMHMEQMAKTFDIMEHELQVIGRYDEVKYNFLEWKKIISSQNYATAKNFKYEDVYDKIKVAYGVTKLTRPPKSADRSYAKHRLLPKNLQEVDDGLKKVFYSNKYLKVYAKRRSFAFVQLSSMKRVLGKRFDLVSKKADAIFVMPKEKYSIKQKIMHNPFVVMIGKKIFPEGSKLRNKIKSKIS